MWRTIASGLLLTSLAGCLQTTDDLTLNSDGSGKVRIETRFPAAANSSVAMLIAAVGSEMGGQGPLFYPPNSLQEAKRFFPGKDFVVNVHQTNADKGDILTIIQVDFKDINALLAGPYGRAHQLTVELDKEGLAVTGITAMETFARLAEMKPAGNSEMTEMMEMMEMSGMAVSDLQKRAVEMRVEFRVTLPNPVTASNGKRDGKSAGWTMERAKSVDAAAYTRQLATVMEARCAADGVKFTPVTPVRLGLQPFPQLTPGAAASGASGPDTNKIAAAVKFVPYGLSVTRAVDLSGHGGGESEAMLLGAVVVPQEFAPKKWGEPALQEAVDSKGNDLKPKASGDDEFRGGRMGINWFAQDEDADADEAAATNTSTDVRHLVSFSFRPPDWKVKEIARVKGLVALHYFAGAEVVKLTNAIPANWIVSEAQAMSGRMDRSEKKLNSPRLRELGLEISLQDGMAESGMTVFVMEVKGGKGALVDAQVFDADGRPWPTFMANQGGGRGDETRCQMMIPGAPKPPLSLAFSASGTGSTVEVPILVEHVSLSSK
jgi:hypothetical protein